MGQASSTAGRSYKAVTAAAKAASDGLMASQAAGAVAVDAQRGKHLQQHTAQQSMFSCAETMRDVHTALSCNGLWCSCSG
jgi:hypothetical protein